MKRPIVSLLVVALIALPAFARRAKKAKPVLSEAAKIEAQLNKAEAMFEAGDYAGVAKIAAPLSAKEPRAMVLMGQLTERGLGGVGKDLPSAVRYYRQASGRQLAAGRYHLARAYRDGIGVEENDEKAFQLAESAAQSDYPPAQSMLGRMYSRGEGVDKNFTQAVSWYEKAAANGDADGNYSLGFMYSSGVGLPKQLSNAERYLRIAADKGHHEAQLTLGLLLEGGQGVTHDLVEAYALLTLAAQAGVKDAPPKLALLKEKLTPEQIGQGEGRAKALARQIEQQKLGKYAPRKPEKKAKDKPRTPVDDAREAFDSGKYDKARELAQPLADKGDVEADYLLGLIYERGLGVPKDIAKSFEFMRVSAEGGHTPAMYYLGVMFERGRNAVKANLAEAYVWYSLAGASGDEDAFDKANTLIPKLKEDQIVDSKARVKKWLDAHRKVPAAPGVSSGTAPSAPVTPKNAANGTVDSFGTQTRDR